MFVVVTACLAVSKEAGQADGDEGGADSCRLLAFCEIAGCI